MSSAAALDQLLADLLRGEPLDVRAIKAFGSIAVHEAAQQHDVVPLIADRLAFAPQLPADLREFFLEEAHRAAALDLAVESELRRMHAAFERRQVPLLLVKGSHLAFTHYARPDLRARIDSDILIAREARDVADQIFLGELGYRAPTRLSGNFTATQQQYARWEGAAPVHVVDVHWRLASTQLFAHVLSFEELLAASEPVPALGGWARGPSTVHALVIACLHRVAHHHDEAEQFKWLYDIHLLASDLTGAEWDAFAAFVLEREISAVSLECLLRSTEWFRTRVPSRLRNDARFAEAAPREATAAYLRVRPKAREVLDDLRALSTWRERLSLLREHLLPPADYMTGVYAPQSRLPLPLLYTARLLRGAGGWFRNRD